MELHDPLALLADLNQLVSLVESEKLASKEGVGNYDESCPELSSSNYIPDGPGRHRSEVMR